MEQSALHYLDNKIVVHHQGAHLSSWQCKGKEQLFLSRNAILQSGKAIRGGVPICFPQFGAFGSGQSHGFARNVVWQKRPSQVENELQFELSHDHESVKDHPYDFDYPFHAVFCVTINDNTLTMRLSVENLNAKPITFTCALHTYFRVSDIHDVLMDGLKGIEYWDNGTNFEQRNRQEQGQLTIDDAIDRVYFNTQRPVSLTDACSTRIISAQGFADTVVWNPWSQGADAFADMAGDEYQQMICIESANVQTPVELASGDAWQGQQKITINT